MTALPPLTVLFVANVRIPSERANAFQILSQCDALAERGHAVAVVAPRRRNPGALPDSQLAAHYGLARAPRIERLFTIDAIDRFPPALQRAPFVVQSATFAWSVKRMLARRRADVVLSRDPWTLALLSRNGAPRIPLVYEAHDLPARDAARQRLAAALRHCRGIVAITRGLADDLQRLDLAGVPVEVLPDGFDPRRFAGLPEKDAARRAIAGEAGPVRDPARPLVVYAGHLFPWKGVDVLVEAAAGSARFDVLVVGGREPDRARVASRKQALAADHVRMLAPVPPARVPLYLAAADVIVLPNSAREAISARYTSPLKLFEAMAARRPIVASDLPSLREVLVDGVNALLVAPDDPAALREGIERCIDDPRAAEARAAGAAADVARFTWSERAARLEAFLRRVLATKAPVPAGGSTR